MWLQRICACPADKGHTCERSRNPTGSLTGADSSTACDASFWDLEDVFWYVRAPTILVHTCLWTQLMQAWRISAPCRNHGSCQPCKLAAHAIEGRAQSAERTRPHRSLPTVNRHARYERYTVCHPTAPDTALLARQENGLQCALRVRSWYQRTTNTPH